MSEYTQEAARADADALIARLEQDASLRDALAADPRTVLLREGIPTDVVDDVVGAVEGAEVEGFAQEALRIHLGNNPSGGFTTIMRPGFDLGIGTRAYTETCDPSIVPGIRG